MIYDLEHVSHASAQNARRTRFERGRSSAVKIHREIEFLTILVCVRLQRKKLFCSDFPEKVFDHEFQEHNSAPLKGRMF